jgi:hypothetical protein
MWWKGKMKYEDLKSNLNKEIFEYLIRKDFKRDNDELVYKRKTNFGFEIFELEHLIQTEELKIGFGIRYNEIESIYAQIHQINSPENSFTLYIDAANLLYFKEANKAKFKFIKPEDVIIGVENIKFIFENYATNYFQKYDSIAKFSELVNRIKHQEDLRGNFQFHGSKEDAAVNGIIASRILKEEETEDLKRKHLANNPSEDFKLTIELINKYFENKN